MIRFLSDAYFPSVATGFMAYSHRIRGDDPQNFRVRSFNRGCVGGMGGGGGMGEKEVGVGWEVGVVVL